MKSVGSCVALVVLLVSVSACDRGGSGGGPGKDVAGGDIPATDIVPSGDWTPAGDPGHMVFRSGEDGHLYRIAAVPGAVPEDLSTPIQWHALPVSIS
ncbi:MAG: hypothetical protein ABIK09_02965 [Pseudomonadota bacterium]